MNISLLDKFIKNKCIYQILFGSLSIIIFIICITFLLIFKHQVIYTYQGSIENNIILIKNLDNLDLLKIEKCNYVLVDNKKYKYNLTLENENENYNVKLYNKNFKNNKSLVKVNLLEYEESLLKFVINSMKGD